MGNTPDSSQAWLELPGGKLHTLGRECRVGRAREGNDIVFEDRPVSSRHLIINADTDGFTLIDQHSTNGTYVNGMLVQKATLLKDGDEIRVANIVPLRFRCMRELKLEAPASFEKTTLQVGPLDARECWLLLVDVAGYSGHIARLGSEGALQRLQAWISEMRPLIEGSGGAINAYTGDGIFAYWPCQTRPADQFLAALRAIEAHRGRAELGFRYVVHQGVVLFTKSSLGEELSGQEVNFVFRAEKIGKRLNCHGMLSHPAVKSLRLESRCDSVGTSAVDGIAGSFTFYGAPRDFAPTAAPSGQKPPP